MASQTMQAGMKFPITGTPNSHVDILSLIENGPVISCHIPSLFTAAQILILFRKFIYIIDARQLNMRQTDRKTSLGGDAVSRVAILS